MKRRIEQLVNGIYEYTAPGIIFSSDRIEAEVRCGSKAQQNGSFIPYLHCSECSAGGHYFGNFTLKNSAQKRMKGFLYSSDARVACEPREFSGIETKISFDVDFCGMRPGDVLEGAFTVCSNMGEASLPFRFKAAERRVQMPGGMPVDLEGFAAFAQEDYQKAYALFCTAEFYRMLGEKYPQYEAMYQGIFSQPADLESMEEFLIGTGRKEPVRFQIKGEGCRFVGLSADIQEKVEITRSGWGFQKLEITSDAEFLIPARSQISTEDFLGSSFILEYLIDIRKLHEGSNFGRITVKSSMQTVYYEVTVKKSVSIGEKKLHLQKKQAQRLYTDYIDFRLKRINIHSWIAEAEEAFACYEQAGGSNVLTKLYQAQIYFASDRMQEACTLLENLERKKAFSGNPAAMGYYQYLTTFYNKEPSYIDYVEEKIEELYLKNQEEWVLQWVLLYLKENLIQHPTRKLEAIRRQFIYGCRSRMMYLEAYFVLVKSPLLLKKLDEFEIQVLRFMCRNDLLNREIVMQVADIAGRWKRYDDALYHILCHCHTKYASRSVVNAICSLLIKGHKVGAPYFNWYEKGVAEGLRLTGLYEYYVESMGKERGGLLPQMIRMYFSYDNTTLNYEKKAVLYANIIENRKKDVRSYDSYRPAIEKFMVDQLMTGHISRELACIYQTFLSKNMLNRRMAGNLARSLFTCEIRCESEIASGVAVVHRQLEGIQHVSLTGHTAEVQIYTDDAWIFVIDRKGKWHIGTIPYTVTRLLDSEEMFDVCRELTPDSPGFLLHFCSEAQRKKQICGKHMRDFCGLLEYEDVRKGYKQQIRQDILDYFYENPKDDMLFEYLHVMDLDELIAADKKKTIELMVSEGMCQEAFALVSKYGPEGIGLGALVRLCSRSILEREREENEMLLYLCEYCFRQGKYDETVLSYLLSGYDGPIENMKKLWKAGKKFELDTFLLEEKILIMLLFMRQGLDGTGEIFESYRRRFGKKLLLNGYLNLMSYEYFVKEHQADDQVFDEIARRLEKGLETDMACKLALLKYDSLREPDEKRLKRMQRILGECRNRNLYFAFFQNLPGSLLRSVQLQERSFVEYRTNPGARVMLHYTIENPGGVVMQERTEMMQNVYEGIFVKDFTLFFGEKLIYTVTEELDGRMEKHEGQVLPAAECPENGSGIQGRYPVLNEMCRSLLEHRESRVKAQAKEYLELEKVIEHIFPLS